MLRSLSFLAALVLPAPALAAEPDAMDSRALAARIDQLLADRWAEARVKPAEPAGDAEFLRRVHLDLVGVVPSYDVTRRFLGDPSPLRRQKLIDELLKSPAYVTHFTNFWRAVLLPENPNTDNLGLRQQL